jgi:fumarate hydratase subunit alpha
MARVIKASVIADTIASLYEEANFSLPQDVVRAMKSALTKESSPVARSVLEVLLENAKIAKKEKLPLCQDCGTTVVFLELGQDIKIRGNLQEAIYEGVRTAVRRGYLRRSMCDPFTRKNTGDNTPPIIHTEIVPGDKIRIVVAPKGGGSENSSAVAMLKPADGRDGVVNFVLDTVKKGAANACSPVIVGVGIGGNFETCALLAKKAALRPIGKKSKNPVARSLEEELFEKVNKLGVGPQGFGGDTTALDVHVEMIPCHIASFPVAVNMQCNSARHKEAVI